MLCRWQWRAPLAAARRATAAGSGAELFDTASIAALILTNKGEQIAVPVCLLLLPDVGISTVAHKLGRGLLAVRVTIELAKHGVVENRGRLLRNGSARALLDHLALLALVAR